MKVTPEPKTKIAIYLPQAVLDQLDQHCLNTTTVIKNARSVFVIQAILEKLRRERSQGNHAKDNHR